jgi:hypothetical protein
MPSISWFDDDSSEEAKQKKLLFHTEKRTALLPFSNVNEGEKRGYK